MIKVMVFGTFDNLHPGHISFFKQAKKRGDYLIVVVARDKYVEESKGRLPTQNEVVRSRYVRKTKIPNKIVLGSKTYNFFRTIRTHKPAIIALGYDQKPSIYELTRQLRRHRLRSVKVTRLRPYKPNLYKTSLLVK